MSESNYTGFEKVRILVFSLIKRVPFHIFLVTLFFSTISIADEDLYLKELEAESEADVGVQNAKNKSHSGQIKQLSTQDIQRKDFEDRLSRELAATYRTYRQLSLEDKLKVVKLYFDNEKDMKKATRYLFELYYK